MEARFDGGAVTSDGGSLLLRQADRRLGLSATVVSRLEDERQPGKTRHRMVDLVRQRVFAIAPGCEDLNDHETLRHDPGIRTAVERDRALASPASLCRFGYRAGRQSAWALHEVLIETLIASHKVAPKELAPDFDATDDAVHGHQEGRFFHGCHDHHCFLPLHVFAGDHLPVACLRPSKADGALHAWAVPKRLVERLREAWPGVRIVMRADSGFCRWRMMSWCERHDVGSIPGLAGNVRLAALAAPVMAEAAFHATRHKQRLFTDLVCGADTRNRERRVIARLEHGDKGANPRFVVASLKGDGGILCDRVCCRRGEMENRMKEQQLHLFADRTSCHEWWANQFRLLPAGLACTLVNTVRNVLKGADMARARVARVATIRLKLFKIGAVILRNTRRVRFHLSSGCPDQALFRLVAARLGSGQAILPLHQGRAMGDGAIAPHPLAENQPKTAGGAPLQGKVAASGPLRYARNGYVAGNDEPVTKTDARTTVSRPRSSLHEISGSRCIPNLLEGYGMALTANTGCWFMSIS